MRVPLCTATVKSPDDIRRTRMQIWGWWVGVDELWIWNIKITLGSKNYFKSSLEYIWQWGGPSMLLHYELEKGLCFCHLVIGLISCCCLWAGTGESGPGKGVSRVSVSNRCCYTYHPDASRWGHCNKTLPNSLQQGIGEESYWIR